MSRARRGWTGPVLGLVAVLAVIVGVTLVVTGGEEASAPGPSTTLPGRSARTRPTLPLSGRTLGVADVEELGGLDVPDDAADFLSARLDDQRQLDVTFTIAPEQVDAFVAGSALPEPVPGDRVVTHASPLWELNTATEVRGVSDVRGDVRRAVELVEENGRVRARVVITPAG